MCVTFICVVLNGSPNVLIGQTIKVEEDVEVIIDCTELIDAAINDGTSNPNVTWYKNGIPIVNGSVINTVISSDNRLCIINNTLLTGSGDAIRIDDNIGSAGVDFGTSGNYTCEVCNISACKNLTSTKVVCGE